MCLAKTVQNLFFLMRWKDDFYSHLVYIGLFALLSDIRVRLFCRHECSNALELETAIFIVTNLTSTSIIKRFTYLLCFFLWNKSHQLIKGVTFRRKYL